MSYVVVYRGFRVECDTAEEAQALMDQLRIKSAQQAARERDQPWDLLTKVLSVVKAAGVHGINATDLAEAVGLPSGRSISPKVKVWARLLGDLGFDMDNVMTTKRVGARERRWVPGKRMSAALKKTHANAG
ncbi:MAG: hypothetical protein HQ519_04005 [Planctomycetes bacterium]|nr:hypothetical protein [Planctomycetota bacterium]